MTVMQFSRQERDTMAATLQRYFSEELDQDLGQFEAEFLLDFISTEIGAYFYNRGLYDAQAILQRRLDELGDAILELEQSPGAG
ncbi:MAG: DUF2164 domain-containing protein [Spongiibacter sp.]|uniref:DUF2164 domain-containing protein n=1 Tax=Spongiibacter thalassae TaxID=2721624 RepID=A0ABX1GJ44_9GAMM|nr:DUF2164 domain-containing protein [Spongiibacter thalassae]MDX1505810.1 DUF2164 domain-containing protein [Spongiibacter sp.]NKI18372.1 DUF2164 domain-containing protein [Spongiibacter thalassae]